MSRGKGTLNLIRCLPCFPAKSGQHPRQHRASELQDAHDFRVLPARPSLSSLWAAAAAGREITVRTRIGLPANLMALDAANMSFLDLQPLHCV